MALPIRLYRRTLECYWWRCMLHASCSETYIMHLVSRSKFRFREMKTIQVENISADWSNHKRSQRYIYLYRFINSIQIFASMRKCTSGQCPTRSGSAFCVLWLIGTLKFCTRIQSEKCACGEFAPLLLLWPIIIMN